VTAKSGHIHARSRASLDRPRHNHGFHEAMVADEGGPEGPSSGHSPRQLSGMGFHFVGNSCFVPVVRRWSERANSLRSEGAVAPAAARAGAEPATHGGRSLMRPGGSCIM
jgi:hypothetical protein